MSQCRALQLDIKDNVAVCTTAVARGDDVEVMLPDGARFSIRAEGDIVFCNKIALRDIAAGEDIVKYGEVIGKATAAIAKGTLANDRNIASQPRRYEDEYILKGGAS